MSQAVAEEGLRLTGTKNSITNGIIQPIIAMIERSVLQVQFQLIQTPLFNDIEPNVTCFGCLCKNTAPLITIYFIGRHTTYSLFTQIPYLYQTNEIHDCSSSYQKFVASSKQIAEKDE